MPRLASPLVFLCLLLPTVTASAETLYLAVAAGGLRIFSKGGLIWEKHAA